MNKIIENERAPSLGGDNKSGCSIFPTQLYGNIKYPNLFRWARIFIFEFTSSILLLYGVMATQYETPPYPHPKKYQPTLNPGHSIFESLALFLVMSFAGQLTGGYSNPAIALALTISKGNKISPKIGAVYIMSDFLGAIAGGGLGKKCIN